MGSSTFAHVVGGLVRYEGRVWRVGLISDCRMRLDPLTGFAVASPSSGRAFQRYGSSVNVAPHAYLEQVEEAELAPGENDRLIRLMERELLDEGVLTEEIEVGNSESSESEDGQMAEGEEVMAVAGVPVGTAPAGSIKAKNQERIAALNAKKAAAAAAKPPKEPKVPKICKCGCGGVTGGNFVPGHDAKFKSWLLQIERGEKKPEELLTEEVRQAYKWRKTADGKGLIPTTTYKGEPHNGYDTAA